MPTLDFLVVPFAGGLVAAFNPCGFAMLPTYLSYFLGLDSEDQSLARSILRGGKVGIALTLGFVTVFGIFGILFELVLSGGVRASVLDSLWIITIVSGLMVFILGVAMIRGFQPVVNIPKLQMGTDGREVGSMYLFGISYGFVSLGCTIGPFLLVVTNSVSTADVAGASIWAFVAYAVGMAAVIVFLTMGLAAGRSGVANKMRSLLPKINFASGIMLVAASLYLVSYGWFQRDPIDNGNGAIDFVEGIQTDLSNWLINDIGARRAGLIMLGTSAVIGLAASYWNWSTKRSTPDGTLGLDPHPDEQPESGSIMNEEAHEPQNL